MQLIHTCHRGNLYMIFFYLVVHCYTWIPDFSTVNRNHMTIGPTPQALDIYNYIKQLNNYKQLTTITNNYKIFHNIDT